MNNFTRNYIDRTELLGVSDTDVASRLNMSAVSTRSYRTGARLPSCRGLDLLAQALNTQAWVMLHPQAKEIWKKEQEKKELSVSHRKSDTPGSN